MKTSGRVLRYVRLIDDYPVVALNNLWTDTGAHHSRCLARRRRAPVSDGPRCKSSLGYPASWLENWKANPARERTRRWLARLPRLLTANGS
jgi:hypothetical protein